MASSDISTRIDIPIYYGYLNIVFSDDFQATIERLRIDSGGKNVANYGAFVYGRRRASGVAEYYAVFDKSPTESSIAHEVAHLVNWIFKDVCISLDLVNDEPQAYLTGWITEQIYRVKNKKAPHS